MSIVERLLTTVDLSTDDNDGPQARRMSVSARHEAVLVDGRHVLLLDDRGWSGTLSGEYEGGIWATETVADMEFQARTVVGQDEPFDDYSHDDMEAGHWEHLAEVLRRQGVVVSADTLSTLPHDVRLSERVRARLSR